MIGRTRRTSGCDWLDAACEGCDGRPCQLNVGDGSLLVAAGLHGARGAGPQGRALVIVAPQARCSLIIYFRTVTHSPHHPPWPHTNYRGRSIWLFVEGLRLSWKENWSYASAVNVYGYTGTL